MNSAIGNCFLNVNWSDKHFFESKVKVSDSQSLSLYIKEFVLFKPVRRAQRNTEICHVKYSKLKTATETDVQSSKMHHFTTSSDFT